MARFAVGLAYIANAQAALYAVYQNAHCYDGGHGGTALPSLAPMMNVSGVACENACDADSKCTAITIVRHGTDWQASQFDCYFQSIVNLSACEYSNQSWSTLKQTAPPPTSGIIVYHLFEPKYTGLANKDAGTFKGDTNFIFSTFNKFSEGNPEASMESNIIEMSEINVTAWGEYEECNAPGASQMNFSCPKNEKDYCCTVHRAPVNHTKTTLPGAEVAYGGLGVKFGFPGWWLSFPRESQDITWTEKKMRRISGLCLGNAWRKDAGGCSDCEAKWDTLDECVADCVQHGLAPDGNATALQSTWDRVFADPSECPDVPFKPAFEDGMLVV